MKNSGLFLGRSKKVFFVCFFEVLMFLWFEKFFKVLVLSLFFFAFGGVANYCLFGFGNLVFLWFLFLFSFV